MEWTAFYEDRVIRSEDAAWASIPDGVVLVVERLKGRRNFWKGDWVWLYDGEFGRVPPSANGEPWSDRPDIPCVSCVKRGELVEDNVYRAIHLEAWNEPWL